MKKLLSIVAIGACLSMGAVANEAKVDGDRSAVTQTKQQSGTVINLAGKQRMLTQKMFKEKFLLYTNQDKKRNAVRLRGSIILFKNGLNALINGEDKRGTAKVTNEAIQTKLTRMHKLYTQVEDIYKIKELGYDYITSIGKPSI